MNPHAVLPAAASHEAVRALARRHSLSAFDAAYLELAVRLSVPLATLDGPLRRAAHAERIELFNG